MRSDHGGVTGDRNRGTEVVEGRCIRRPQLRLLRPVGARALEDVDGAGVLTRIVVPVGPDHRGVAGECNGIAEVVGARPIDCGQLRLLRPDVTRPHEYVRGTRAHASIIVQMRSDHDSVAGDRDRVAEVLPTGCVRRRQLRLLRPVGSRTNVHVGGARTLARIVALRRPDHGGVAGDRDGGTVLVRFCSIRCGNLLKGCRGIIEGDRGRRSVSGDRHLKLQPGQKYRQHHVQDPAEQSTSHLIPLPQDRHWDGRARRETRRACAPVHNIGSGPSLLERFPKIRRSAQSMPSKPGVQMSTASGKEYDNANVPTDRRYPWMPGGRPRGTCAHTAI